MPIPWRRICGALALGHLAIAAARVPFDVYGKRWRRIAELRQRGEVRFFLDTKEHDGAAAVDWILQHTQSDTVVLHRGATSGAVEFVPPLIYPRLLYAECWVAGDGSIPLHRPVASGPIDGRRATAVLVCEPEQRGKVQRLRIEAR
ncbi:MAG: hypothetical protein R3F56_20835 [Planctomycetota bacterium]